MRVRVLSTRYAFSFSAFAKAFGVETGTLTHSLSSQGILSIEKIPVGYPENIIGR